METVTLIYKIVHAELWRAAEATGVFCGAAVDRADGYIHFSDRSQVGETAAKHFAGQPGLLLIAVEASALGPDLKWEPARGGALFPHLYAPLPVALAHWVKPMPLGLTGALQLPDLSS